MKKISSCFILLMFVILASASPIFAGGEHPQIALLIIDVQNFYFPGGAVALENPEEASVNARKILEKFRNLGLLVIHVRHNFKSGGEIHENVKPLNNEKVINKNEVNCFKDTDLLSYLKENEIKKLVIVGMQTHLCVEAAARAGHDLGFECVVVQDACATRDLKYAEEVIPAKQVHLSTLSTLSQTYANVIDTRMFLETF